MININQVRTYSVLRRKSRVKIADFAKKPVKQSSFLGFYNSLPDILKARDFRLVCDAIVKAHKQARSVIFMGGGHVLKCGLNPVLIELLRRKILTCVCLNGAGIIHDFEIALAGRTSEDVGETLKDGKFGMGKETAEFINNAVCEGVGQGLGLGESVAVKINQSKLAYKKLSLIFNAYKYQIPVCVFVAIGTDIIHQHPGFDAALTAEGSFRDFKRLTEEIIGLNDAGVVLNFGSTVLMPEVFLKALNLARNLGNRVKDFRTANFDMIQHYRPMQNIVLRPTQDSGKGYYITGHHEIMLPLLAQTVIEKV